MQWLLALLLLALTQSGLSHGGQRLTTDHASDDRSEPMLTWWSTANEKVDLKFRPYTDRAGRVVRLSSAETVPFRLAPYENRSRFEPATRENFDPTEYAAGIRRFGDVRSCLQESEREKAQPDLTKFDWSLIDTHGEAYACYGWIITSYETVSDFRKWLEIQGFRVVRYKRFTEPTGRRGMAVQAAINMPYWPKRNLKGWLRSFVESPTYNLVALFQEGTGLSDLVILAHRLK